MATASATEPNSPTRKYAYCIYKKLGGQFVAWWPMGGFGEFCLDESAAMAEYEREAKRGACVLKTHELVVGPETNSILGLVAGGEVLKQC